MALVEESLVVHRFDNLPSSDKFSSQIEPSNVPAIFVGAVNDWSAFTKWNPRAGGLDYLEALAGCVVVEAMLSKSGPVFYGDLRSHERVPLYFSSFIGSCKSHLRKMHTTTSSITLKDEFGVQPTCSNTASSESGKSLDHIYLAQVPILNMDTKEKCSLDSLRVDIQVPMILKTKQISFINLWMNREQSRSSIHYDPHHNLLCVVAGCKKISLWPPSASSLLYPMPIYGEASNHSSVDIENPNLAVHTRAKDAFNYRQQITLYPGDALFIPEGWFHQVDSDDLTIAVNFWWKSEIMVKMLDHMDAYYLHRILNRMLEKEKVQMLCNISHDGLEHVESTYSSMESHLDVSDGILRSNLDKQDTFDLQEPSVSVLHDLVSLVHDHMINVSGHTHGKNPPKEEALLANPNSECSMIPENVSFISKNDDIARILRASEPLVLRKVFLAMVRYFPRTLEALVLHVLSPAGAEILTRKFDELDQQTTKEQQTDFYQLFYSVFDDQGAAMDAILNGKELFSSKALRNVLDAYLGVNLDRPT